MFFNLRRFLPQKLRRMKKFVLHYSRCTVVTRFFNLDFVRIQTEGTLGTRLLSKKVFFLSEKSNFFCLRPTWKKFPNCPK